MKIPICIVKKVFLEKKWEQCPLPGPAVAWGSSSLTHSENELSLA